MEKTATGTAKTRAQLDRDLAREVLGGTGLAAKDILALAKRLKDEQQDFTLARRVLVRAAKDPDLELPQNSQLKLKITQQTALCTYKDNDLPADERLDRALEIPARAVHEAAPRSVAKESHADEAGSRLQQHTRDATS